MVILCFRKALPLPRQSSTLVGAKVELSSGRAVGSVRRGARLGNISLGPVLLSSLYLYRNKHPILNEPLTIASFFNSSRREFA